MFWTRLGSGIVLLVIAIASMWIGGPVLAIILWLISMVAYKEMSKALGCGEDKRLNAQEIVGLVGVTLYYATVYISHNTGSFVFMLMAVSAVFLGEMFVYVLSFPKVNATQTVASVFSFMYAPFMLSYIYLTRESNLGIYTVWLILISSWGCDTCAYAVGKLIGKKKIFPVLSPHKSLEGCIGGVLGATIIGGIYGHFALTGAFKDNQVVIIIAFICAIGAVMSMVGDLAASAIKRNVNIKDYGKLIPGHGGIMDRFDSTIVTAPMVYFLTVLLLNI